MNIISLEMLVTICKKVFQSQRFWIHNDKITDYVLLKQLTRHYKLQLVDVSI